MNNQVRIIVLSVLAALLSACGGGGGPAPIVTGVVVSAPSLSMNGGSSQTIFAVVTGTGAFNNAVTWTLESGPGTLSSPTSMGVTFTAPTSSTAATSVIRATSVQDPSQSGSISLSIQPGSPTSSIMGVSLDASKLNLRAAETSLLTVTVSGTGAFDPSVTWTIEAGGVGTLSSTTGGSVTYQAPTSSLGKVVRITATSVQDASKLQTIFLGLHPNHSSVAAGGVHALAIKSDGTLLSWGNDFYGQLGNGDDLGFNQPTPVSVTGASDIVAVAAGRVHSLALKADGTVLAWGSDAGGQLGNDAALEDQSAPVAVSGASNVIAISAGYYFSLALKSDGTMLAWGSDSRGQLGDDLPKADKPTPVPVDGASNIVAIGAGTEHALALKSDGTMLSWGLDVDGQLGDNVQLEDHALPVAVMGIAGVVGIAVGNGHSLALKADGTVLAWGSDFGGQLGDNIPKVNKPTPVPVNGASGVIAIAGGFFHSLAARADGTVLAWGSDTYGELGDGTQPNPQGIPVAVENISNIVAVAAGLHFSLALNSDGTLRSWGRDQSGQLGDDVSGPGRNSPVSVLLGAFTIRLP
jgi:Regulator of chromosome condensation (RCC1) repeat